MISLFLKVNCRSCNRENVPARIVTGHLDRKQIMTCSKCCSLDVYQVSCFGSGRIPKMRVERGRISVEEELARR